MVCHLSCVYELYNTLECFFINSAVFLSGCVCVCLGPEASVHDEIRALCQAVWLSSMLREQQSNPLPPFVSLLNVNRGAVSHLHNAYFLFSFKGHWDMVHESHKLMDKIFSPFLKG